MMKRQIFLLAAVLIPVLLLTSCSGEKTVSEKMADDLDNGMPVEVLKNTAPLPQTPEAVRVFKYPSEQESAEPSRACRISYETIDLKNLDSKKACEIIARIAPETVFMEGAKSSQLIVKGAGDDITRLKKVLDSVDLPLRQIMIESKVVEVSENALANLGISWPGNGVRFVISEKGKIKFDDISAAISALIGSGNARLIASPSIATIDNHEASVNIGSKIPFAVPVNSASSSVQWAVQYIDAGVSLKITPRLGAKERISVTIHPEVSSISEWRTTAAGEFPVIATRNADTRIEVMNGQTIVIGGLVNESDRENISKIPLAGDIPVVKELFSKKTTEKARTEVIFLITPRLI